MGLIVGIIGAILAIIVLLAAIGLKSKIAFAIFAVLLVVTIIGFSNTDWSDNSKKKTYATDSYGHDQYDAIAAAEKYVREQLKSPTSAKFSQENATVSKSIWTITGKVDAQNSFGATIRNSFIVTITFTSKDYYNASGSIY